MATKTRGKFALSSANAISIQPSSSLKITGMAARSQSVHETADVVRGPEKCPSPGRPTSQAQMPSSPVSRASSMTPTPTNLTEFENANLILQKRLKVNNSQITKVTFEFSELKARYLTTLTIPPTTTAAFRTHILSQLQSLCTRHGRLLDLRRDTLEKQQDWLEKAMEVQTIQKSDRFLLAIDMQVEAAKDLVQRESQGALMQQLAWV